MVLFLDLDEARATARGGWGDELYEKAEMQRTVRRLFREMMDGEGGDEGLGDLVAVDAGGSVEEVAEEIWGRVKERVSERVRRVDDGDVGRTVRIMQ